MNSTDPVYLTFRIDFTKAVRQFLLIEAWMIAPPFLLMLAVDLLFPGALGPGSGSRLKDFFLLVTIFAAAMGAGSALGLAFAALTMLWSVQLNEFQLVGRDRRGRRRRIRWEHMTRMVHNASDWAGVHIESSTNEKIYISSATRDFQGLLQAIQGRRADLPLHNFAGRLDLNR